MDEKKVGQEPGKTSVEESGKVSVDPDKVKRNTGRRWQDHVKEKSAWLLVIGALMQGGFLLITSRLLTMGEAQLERERSLMVSWHNDLAERMREQTRAIERLTERLAERDRKRYDE